jgi:hypothetical protein
VFIGLLLLLEFFDDCVERVEPIGPEPAVAFDPRRLVGQGLVDESQLAQRLGLEDGAGDRAADAGGRGTQGVRSGRVTGRRINGRLYQWRLILTTVGPGCQPRRSISTAEPVAVEPRLPVI